jgi:hypothetical protein
MYGSVWIGRHLLHISSIPQIPRYFLCWQLPAMCFDQVGDVIDRTELQDCLLVAVSDVVKGRTPPLLSHFRIRQSDGTLICNNEAGIYV